MKLGKFDFENKTVLMGVINVTPDSFSDGGEFLETEKAISHAKQMLSEGADIIDIGGESTRPRADDVNIKTELERVIPVLQELSKESIPLSIDSYKPQVVEKAIAAGANIVNDISGLRNEKMRQLVAKHNVPAIIMHMQETPRNMQNDPQYEDVVNDIKTFFQTQIQKAQDAGIKDIVLDPGIGFGKTVEHNLQIINRISEFKELNCPILLGTSRKSFIGKLTGATEKERLPGTIASNVIGILNGADIIRVHDIKELKQAVDITKAIQNA